VRVYQFRHQGNAAASSRAATLMSIVEFACELANNNKLCMDAYRSGNFRMPQSSQAISIFGAGGHGRVVAELALALGYNVTCFLADEISEPLVLGIPVRKAILDDAGSSAFAIAIGDNASREAIFLRLIKEYPNSAFPSLVHPRANLSPSTIIGQGAVVFAGALVGPETQIGSFTIVNHGAQADHNNNLSDFSSLGPGCVLGGNVKLGRAAVVAIGAVVKHGVALGDNSVLGANSYLDQNLPPNSVAYGSPARIIRARQAQDKYL
jgi:sugar O-acyltransferase (sialic acid O-acetyltransferase NeuD family)